MIRILRSIIKLIKFLFTNIRGEVNNPKLKKIRIPKHEIEAIAQCLLPDAIAFFETFEGQKEFNEWKAQQNKMIIKNGKRA